MDIPHSNESVSRRAARFATGVTLGFVVAQLVAWPVAHLTPVVVMLLMQEAEPMPFRQGFRTFAFCAANIAAGGLLTSLLYPWPAVLLASMGLVLYGLHRFLLHTSEHTLVLVSAIIGFAVMPVLVVLLPALGLIGGIGFIADFAVAILIAWLTWLLIPPAVSTKRHVHHKDTLSPREAHDMALTLTIVVLPLVGLFLSLGLTKVLIVAYTVLFAFQSYSSAGGREMGAASMFANGLYGGVAVLIVHELLVILPNPAFMAILIFAVTLYYGIRIFELGPNSHHWSAGLMGFLMMIGAVLMKSVGVVTTGEVLDRVLQLLAATVYVTVAFLMVEMIRSRKKNSVIDRIAESPEASTHV
jgi:hypothetical protein